MHNGRHRNSAIRTVIVGRGIRAQSENGKENTLANKFFGWKKSFSSPALRNDPGAGCERMQRQNLCADCRRYHYGKKAKIY